MGYPIFKVKNPKLSEPLYYLRKLSNSDVTLSRGINEDTLETYDKQKFMDMFIPATFADIWNDAEMKEYLYDTCMLIDSIQKTMADDHIDSDAHYLEYLECAKNMLNGGFGEYPSMVDEQVAILESFIHDECNVAFTNYIDERFDELIEGFNNSDFTDFTEYILTNGYLSILNCMR